MAPSTWAARFVDTALSKKGDLSLSYSRPDLLWVVRDHFLALLLDFPSLRPSAAPFTHNDGSSVNLFCAAGYLPLPSPIPPIHATIWVHESYPLSPPLVFLSSPASPLQHPYLDPSGAVDTPYTQTWDSSSCTLSDLARNLVRIFTFWPPFPVLCSPRGTLVFSSSRDRTQQPSRREAMDKLSMRLEHDVAKLKAETQADIERMAADQTKLYDRAHYFSFKLFDMKRQRNELRSLVKQLTEEADVLRNWLVANDSSTFPAENVEEAFEPADQYSWNIINMEAGEAAIDDTMMALEKALEVGLVRLEDYLKHIRKLSKEHFVCRAKQVHVRYGDPREWWFHW